MQKHRGEGSCAGRAEQASPPRRESAEPIGDESSGRGRAGAADPLGGRVLSPEEMSETTAAPGHLRSQGGSASCRCCFGRLTLVPNKAGGGFLSTAGTLTRSSFPKSPQPLTCRWAFGTGACRIQLGGSTAPRRGAAGCPRERSRGEWAAGETAPSREGSGKEAEVSVEKDRETLGVAGDVGGREPGAR